MKDEDCLNIERLEGYWRDFVLSFPWTTNLDSAVVASYPKLPYYETNHVANINIDEDEAEDFLEEVTKDPVLHDSPTLWFRVSPITRPESFGFLLEKKGFRRDFETSVMTFKRNRVHITNDGVRINQISKHVTEDWKRTMCTIFGVPPEWKDGFDDYVGSYTRKGARCYLAYINDEPVGTSSLLSLRGCGGIFSVGTLKQYRGRGIGTALTMRALTDSAEEGNTLHLLYADKGEYAEHLYKKMGFNIDYTVTWFVKEI
jgi:GNAT superfamily N-acetyltransferase